MYLPYQTLYGCQDVPEPCVCLSWRAYHVACGPCHCLASAKCVSDLWCLKWFVKMLLKKKSIKNLSSFPSDFSDSLSFVSLLPPRHVLGFLGFLSPFLQIKLFPKQTCLCPSLVLIISSVHLWEKVWASHCATLKQKDSELVMGGANKSESSVDH